MDQKRIFESIFQVGLHCNKTGARNTYTGEDIVVANEDKKETERKIKEGIYRLVDLNK